LPLGISDLSIAIIYTTVVIVYKIPKTYV
jgi:hypothetical protein